VAKHGNRSVSSRSGSSDLLAAFGINLDMNAERSREALDDLGVCFLFAPKYHTGFRHAMPVRQQLKTRTLFNVLGPLINPAHPPLALIGVYSPELVLPIAETCACWVTSVPPWCTAAEWMKCLCMRRRW
jgi:anthranilate synthase/phosphoribosyltransferase